MGIGLMWLYVVFSQYNFKLTPSSQHQYVYQKHLGNLSVFDGCLVNRVVIK
jgi:hypothetical protein